MTGQKEIVELVTRASRRNEEALTALHRRVRELEPGMVFG